MVRQRIKSSNKETNKQTNKQTNTSSTNTHYVWCTPGGDIILFSPLSLYSKEHPKDFEHKTPGGEPQSSEFPFGMSGGLLFSLYVLFNNSVQCISEFLLYSNLLPSVLLFFYIALLYFSPAVSLWNVRLQLPL